MQEVPRLYIILEVGFQIAWVDPISLIYFESHIDNVLKAYCLLNSRNFSLLELVVVLATIVSRNKEYSFLTASAVFMGWDLPFTKCKSFQTLSKINHHFFKKNIKIVLKDIISLKLPVLIWIFMVIQNIVYQQECHKILNSSFIFKVVLLIYN